MEIRQYFGVFRRWWWLVVLGTVVTAVTAYALSRMATPIYSSTTTLLINQSQTSSNAFDYTGLLTSERLTKTYSELLRKRLILDEVVSNLKLPMNADQLAGAISVQTIRDTLLIEISVEDTDPRQAAAIAGELTKVFIAKNSEMQTGRFAESRKNLNEQISILDNEIKNTQAALDASRASTLPNAASETVRLDGQLSEFRRSYANLVASFGQVRLAEAQVTNNVILVEPPEIPVGPIRPSIFLNTLIGMVAGLVLSLSAVFGLELLDDKLRTTDDIQQSLGLNTLGTVYRFSGSDNKPILVTADRPQSPFGEAFRTLRTNIQYSAIDSPLRTLLITSANPSEGKSTLAANLAVVFAQSGQRTILVDADLRRPSQHRFFHLQNDKGLTSNLVHEPFNVEEGLQTTQIENLRIMTSGPIPPNPSELLGSRRMAQFQKALAEIADIVIFDSPPVLAVTDPLVLAPMVNGVLLVIDSNSTRRGAGARARDDLARVRAHMLGVVINNLSARAHGEYYAYRGYYTADAPARPSKPKTGAKPSKNPHRWKAKLGRIHLINLLLLPLTTLIKTVW